MPLIVIIEINHLSRSELEVTDKLNVIIKLITNVLEFEQ